MSEDHLDRFLACGDALERYIRRRVRDADEAAELFQELSILVLRHDAAPSTRVEFAAWCRGIARNLLGHHFRAKRRQAALLDRAEPEARTLVAQPPADPEHTFATRELLDRIFADVDDRTRTLMLERYLLGQSAQEIAVQRQQSATAVRMRLMRARANVCGPDIARHQSAPDWPTLADRKRSLR